MVREVQFYESKEGQKPIQRFLDKLDTKQVQKVTWTLRFIEEQKIPRQAIAIAEERKKD